MRVIASIFAVAALLAACTPGSPVYFGPPIVTLEGQASGLETGEPLAHAEVCVFTADTLCVAADSQGKYRAAVLISDLLEGGRADVRFRASGYPTAVLALADLTEGKYTEAHCRVSARVTLSRQPVACISQNE